MLSKQEWFCKNQELLDFLYHNLIHICSSYKIKIIDNQHAINDFIEMMYNTSNKYYVLPRSSYPDFLINNKK